MKNNLIRIAAGVSCIVLAIGLAMPAFANTVTYSHHIPTAEGCINLTAQQTATKDSPDTTYAVHEVDYLQYDYSVPCWISTNLSDPYGYQGLTLNTNCPVGKTNMNYINSYGVTGAVALWAQQPTYTTTQELINGIVAFH